MSNLSVMTMSTLRWPGRSRNKHRAYDSIHDVCVCVCVCVCVSVCVSVCVCGRACVRVLCVRACVRVCVVCVCVCVYVFVCVCRQCGIDYVHCIELDEKAGVLMTTWVIQPGCHAGTFRRQSPILLLSSGLMFYCSRHQFYTQLATSIPADPEW